MVNSTPRGAAPAVLRIRLRHTSIDEFIDKFGANLSRNGVFVAARTPPPVGTRVRLELQLATGKPALRCDGEVQWIRAFDEKQPDEPHGMGLRFTSIDVDSRRVIDRALALRASDQPRSPLEESIAALLDAAPPSARPARRAADDAATMIDPLASKMTLPSTPAPPLPDDPALDDDVALSLGVDLDGPPPAAVAGDEPAGAPADPPLPPPPAGDEDVFARLDRALGKPLRGRPD